MTAELAAGSLGVACRRALPPCFGGPLHSGCAMTRRKPRSALPVPWTGSHGRRSGPRRGMESRRSAVNVLPGPRGRPVENRLLRSRRHGPGCGGHAPVALGCAPAGWRAEARTFPRVIVNASGAPCSGMPKGQRAGSSAEAGSTELARLAERASEANSEGRIAVASADAAGGRRLAVKLHSALRLQNGAPARHGQQTCRDRRSLHGQMACSPQRVAPGSDGTGTWLEAGPTHGCSVPGRGTTAAMAFLPTCRHPESGATASREGHSGNAEGTNANGHPIAESGAPAGARPECHEMMESATPPAKRYHGNPGEEGAPQNMRTGLIPFYTETNHDVSCTAGPRAVQRRTLQYLRSRCGRLWEPIARSDVRTSWAD